MEQIKIEKNVPLPKRKLGNPRASRYPWDSMEVGDSFVFPTKVKRTTAMSLSYRTGKITGKRFAIRSVNEGIRVWRLNDDGTAPIALERESKRA